MASVAVQVAAIQMQLATKGCPRTIGAAFAGCIGPTPCGRLSRAGGVANDSQSDSRLLAEIPEVRAACKNSTVVPTQSQHSHRVRMHAARQHGAIQAHSLGSTRRC